MKVAVVGTGLAGLSAAWHLARDHRVTLFERHQRLGMDAHSIDVATGGAPCRIDVPMRVVYEGYYPNVARLYRAREVDLEPVEYSGSFSTLGGGTYFRYESLRVGGLSLPVLGLLRHVSRTTLSIVADAIRFFVQAPRELERGAIGDQQLDEYLRARGYSSDFREGFFLPTVAGICTCTYDAVRASPAATIVDYFARNILYSPVKRVAGGVQRVVSRLRRDVEDVRLGAAVARIVRREGGASVVDAAGGEHAFDHVVIASQANHTLAMLEDATAEEREALAKFRYERAAVVMHTDPRLLPRDREAWCPVNFVMSRSHAMPMASIWLNPIYPELRGQEPVFQTWNPIVEAAPERTLAQAALERPVVDAGSVAALDALRRLHRQPGRRVWFCGAYASPGIPLLESAATSGLRVASAITGREPWPLS